VLVGEGVSARDRSGSMEPSDAGAQSSWHSPPSVAFFKKPHGGGVFFESSSFGFHVSSFSG
jgi:hypothetical protein